MDTQHRLKNIKATVEYLLRACPEARDSDIKLIRMVFRHYGLPTNINELPDEFGSIFESVRRTRQKVQADNPDLRASARVEAMRTEQQQAWTEFANS